MTIGAPLCEIYGFAPHAVSAVPHVEALLAAENLLRLVSAGAVIKTLNRRLIAQLLF